MPRLDLSLIVRDPEIQPRESMDHELIAQYAADMLQGIAFPPVVVYHDGERYWLSEGFHRTEAAEATEEGDIEADIRPGTRDDALWNAIGSNKEHDAVGLRRSNADKRRAVEMALRCRPGISDREIARHCGVSQPFVGKLRPVFAPSDNGYQMESREVTRTINGQPQTYTMQVAAIGRAEPAAPPPVAPGLAIVEPPPFALDGTPEPPKPEGNSKFNQTNEMVEWAWWTWNPVTGCEHNCVYCYARDIANRFYAEKFTPTFRPERLDAPRNTTRPEKADAEIGWGNVFVCSMADLFGRWVPDEWIESVFASCRRSPEWNYLFLTKFPNRYVALDFPETAWIGTSVDEQKRVANAEKAFAKIKGKVPVTWLSVEPLREPLKFKRLDLFDWIVIGGQSRSSGAPEFLPPFEWVARLATEAKAAGCKVYIKPNVGFDGATRPREYPGKAEIA